MPITTPKEMFGRAYKEGYAIGAFNVNNMEIVQGITEAAKELNAPLILQVSKGARAYANHTYLMKLVEAAVIETGLPIALHLDHGNSFELCKSCIDGGFTSVMIDASKFEYSENVRITKEVVQYAKSKNVSVEAELGHVGGQEDNVSGSILYADVNECESFVKETGIDCLAPALGSVHGPYKGEPKLGFTEMLEIKERTNKPLVLHGGSGIPDYQIKEAISRGTCKINVNTECQQEWTKIVRDTLNNNDKVYDPRKVIGPGMEGIRNVVREKIKLFGSENKA